jgi:hypothetical protein
VVGRRSWFNEEKFTREVLDLYKRPLCVQGTPPSPTPQLGNEARQLRIGLLPAK